MARIVIEVSDQNKQLVLALKELARLVASIEARGSGGKPIDYAHIERAISAGTAAIEHEAHRTILSSLDLDAANVRITGKLYSRVSRYEATYTLAGQVEVERSIYRRDGERNGKIVDAVSLRAGVVADSDLTATLQPLQPVQRGNMLGEEPIPSVITPTEPQ